MPKHVHRFYKQETDAKSKYMWKCTECGWFVHAGLEYVMIGKPGICWSCDSVYTVSSPTLLQDKPKCNDCIGQQFDIEAYMKEQMKKDEIEVIEPDEAHSSECGVWEGGECSCR